MNALSKTQYVYQIRNKVSNRRYIGSAGCLPCGRWAQHVSDLRNGNGNPRFQAEWNQYPSMEYWEFSVLEEISPKLPHGKLEQRKAEFITSVEDSLRLNMPKRTTNTRDKHAEVIRLIEAGVKYTEIRDQVGISVGMISKIRKSLLTT